MTFLKIKERKKVEGKRERGKEERKKRGGIQKHRLESFQILTEKRCFYVGGTVWI